MISSPPSPKRGARRGPSLATYCIFVLPSYEYLLPAYYLAAKLWLCGRMSSSPPPPGCWRVTAVCQARASVATVTAVWRVHNAGTDVGRMPRAGSGLSIGILLMTERCAATHQSNFTWIVAYTAHKLWTDMRQMLPLLHRVWQCIAIALLLFSFVITNMSKNAFGIEHSATMCKRFIFYLN